MGNGRVVFHKLGSYFCTYSSNCWTFGIIGSVIAFAVDALDDIMVALFAYAGT